MNVLRFNFRNEENRKSVSAVMVDEGYIIQNTNPQPGSYLMNIYILDENDTNPPKAEGTEPMDKEGPDREEVTEVEEVE